MSKSSGQFRKLSTDISRVALKILVLKVLGNLGPGTCVSTELHHDSDTQPAWRSDPPTFH